MNNAPAPQETVQQFLEKARQAQTIHKTSDALRFFFQALKLLIAGGNEESAESADAHYNLGLCCQGENRSQEAAYYFQRARQIRSVLLGADHAQTKEAKLKEKECLDAQDNRVTIRIWAKQGSVTGHASLETYRGGKEGNGIYVSFWPKGQQPGWFSTPTSHCSVNKHYTDHFHTLAEDRQASQLSDDEIFMLTLTSLDVDEILNEYEAIQTLHAAEKLKWALWGGTSWPKEETELQQTTCSHLCLRLLIAGGINDYFMRPIEPQDFFVYQERLLAYMNGSIPFSIARMAVNHIIGESESKGDPLQIAVARTMSAEAAYFSGIKQQFPNSPGSLFIGHVHRPKPFDVATLATKALMVEHEDIFRTSPRQIITQDNHFVQASNPVLHEEIIAAKNQTENLRHLVDPFTASHVGFQLFLYFSYFNAIHQPHMHGYKDYRHGGPQRIVSPVFFLKLAMAQYLKKHGFTLSLPQMIDPAPPLSFLILHICSSNVVLDVTGITNPMLLRTAKKIELRAWQELFRSENELSHDMSFDNFLNTGRTFIVRGTRNPQNQMAAAPPPQSGAAPRA